MKQYPVFVYGTLRSGFGNYRNFLEGYTTKEEFGRARGVMYDVGAFPAIVEGKGTIMGEIMYIAPEVYNHVLTALDNLEGYIPDSGYSMYIRKLINVLNADNNMIKCWAYFWNYSTKNLPLISHGDWKRWVWEKYYR